MLLLFLLFEYECVALIVSSTRLLTQDALKDCNRQELKLLAEKQKMELDLNAVRQRTVKQDALTMMEKAKADALASRHTSKCLHQSTGDVIFHQGDFLHRF
jgi:hypothetical protein